MTRTTCRLTLLSLFALLSPGVQAYDNIEYLAPLGSDPVGRQVAVAASLDRTYVYDDKKSALVLFSAEGKYLKAVGRSGSGPDGFEDAKRVAIGPDGTVFVADTGNSRIQMLDPEGKFLGRFGTRGSEPGHLSYPEAVAVGGDGRVYVADTGNHRIQVFTQEGVFLFGFGGKGSLQGQFSSPKKVLVDPSDNLYVLDYGNERIQKFDSKIRFQKEFPLAGQDFTVDAYGFIYVLDASRGKVKEINPEGATLGEFGSLGSGRGQMKKPSEISAAPDGTLLIADTGNTRVLRVALTTKTKTARLPQNLAMKLLVSGPTAMIPQPAAALASGKGLLYAYVPKTGFFLALDEKGKDRLRFGRKEGKDPSVTRGARGFAVSEAHGVFVADTDSNRMQVFDHAGKFKLEVGAGGMFGKGKEGRLSEPGAVAVNEKGTVYVAESGNARVSAFNPKGDFLFAFGPQIGGLTLQDPAALVYDQEGFIYVLDRGLKKVIKCEPSGGFVSSWGELGEGIGQFVDPVAMAYDGKTYLYVLDAGNPRVSVFDKEGNWITNFFSRGSDDRGFKQPSAIAVTGSRLSIADPGQNRILSFALRPRIAPPVSLSTKAVAGQISLEWPEQKDPWIDLFRVYRATQASGPFADVGTSSTTVFRDSQVSPETRYWYRVAVVADTGDEGPRSLPVEVFVPSSINRAAVELSTITIGNIFSANYKWYLKNPLGSAVVVNNLNVPFQNVKLAFRLKDFMDFATEKVIENLGPKETVEVPLAATLNNKILEVSEDTPIQAEFTVTFYEEGKPQRVSRTQALKVYSRNAITWEDPKRIANFITPKDPPVLDLGREALRQAPKGPPAAEYLNGNLVIAMHIWDALGAVGVRFLPSPNNPFEQISEDPAFPVDYTQFPRETLRRKSGECDDLVTLIASMLEGATVKTALLDYPGHIALMFDTGASDAAEVGLPPGALIRYKGSLWIPLEATLVGSPFHEAVRKALSAYREMLKAGKVGIIDPRVAWETYEPATHPASEAPIQTPDAADVAKRFDEESQAYLKARYDYLTRGLKKRIAKDENDPELANELGIVYIQHGKTEEAVKEFARAAELDPRNAAALTNLGNLSYMEGKFDEALAHYQKAADEDPLDAGLWMNLTRAALKAGKAAEAGEFSKKALALDPGLEPAVQSLLK